ncbi:E3 ubiquitin-protein ligase [Tripterygium wilfordii]|uniref:E3 ubiquitin-protein ligase n=1 Tax=Tripterygium wilfordii TaxID=458696 RepID=A0A7J7DBU9_TRIWF|nr:uncharacterized protein LOC120003525 [Tripterygium wilfordii]KAF5743817.1 E3 ubiquitin-protein ligase [Tripterygium wilfordii]
MEGIISGSSNNDNGDDHDLFVDDFYFSALFDDDQVFPISDEKYALELHLQEALISSLISFKRPENHEASNHQIHKPTLTKRVKESGESSSQSQCFCAICMDVKQNEEMFSTNTCTHTFCTDCITKYVAAKIQGNISMVKCPGLDCNETLELENVRDIIRRKCLIGGKTTCLSQ